MVYVQDDGTIRVGFAKPKQALSLFRSLAAGETTAKKELYKIFDKKTQNGMDLSHYDKLIKKALLYIEEKYQKRMLEDLVSRRKGKIEKASEQAHASNKEYDLLTWLVIPNPEDCSNV